MTRRLRVVGKDETGYPVWRVSRSCSPELLDGFVVGTGTAWMALALLWNRLTLDGFVFVRRDDVVSKDRQIDVERLVRRSLELQDAWPPQPSPGTLDLDDTPALVRGLSAVYPVVTIYTERVDAGLCFIGVPVDFTDRGVVVHEIRYDGGWHPELSEWDYEDITRIDVLDTYARRLYAVAVESRPAG